MKKHHHLLRTMKKTFREEEQRHNKQYSQSETFFQRLVTRMRNTDAEDSSVFNRDDMHITNPLQNPAAAAKRTIEIPIQKWMKQRGVFNQADKKFSDMAKELFKMLDVNNAGFLRGKEIVKEIMELGVVTQPQVISESLMSIYNTQDLYALKLSLDEFRGLLRGDSRTEHMLNRLNQDATSYKKKQDEKKSSVLISYDANSSILTSHKRSSSNPDATPLHILKIEVPKLTEISKSITFKDLHAMIDKWWSDLNVLKSNQVHINSVCDKLVQLEMIGDRKEGRKYIEDIIGVRHHLDNIAFHRIFLRCLLKDLVYFFAEKLAAVDMEELKLSGKYSVTKFKRELLQAGLKLNSDTVTYEEGHAVLQGVERYHNFVNDPIPQTDFEQFKQDWAKSTGKPYVDMVAEYSIESAPDILTKSAKSNKKRALSYKRRSGETPVSIRENIRKQPKIDFDKDTPILSHESKPSRATSPSPLPNSRSESRAGKTLKQARKDIITSAPIDNTQEIPAIIDSVPTQEHIPRPPSTKVIYEPEKNATFTITAVRPGSPSRQTIPPDSIDRRPTSQTPITPNLVGLSTLKSMLRASHISRSRSPVVNESPVPQSHQAPTQHSAPQTSPRKRVIIGIKEKPDLKSKSNAKGKSFSFNPDRTPPKAEYLFDRDYREFKLEQQNKLYADFQKQIDKHV